MRVFPKVVTAVAGSMLVSFGIWAAAKYDALGGLFSTRFMPHRFCYMLDGWLTWTNAISDTLIWLSYIAIAVGLAVLLRKTRTLLAFRWIFVAFGLFIVACGFTHFLEVVTLWVPYYWLSTSVKVLTAVASIATAIAFAPLVPRAAEAIRLFQEAYSKSERARADILLKLLDTEERMKLAVESAGLATWERNLITKEVIWDDRCRAIFGVSDNRSLRYEDFLCRVHPDDRASTEALIQAALGDQREFNAGFRVVRGGGEIRHVISRGKAFSDRNGCPIRFIGTLIDVTREHLAEDALIRTEKLASAGRMAATIAHEINNPLDAALGLVYVSLNHDHVPPEVAEHLKMVEGELHRAAQITRNTLTFYRESPNPIPTNIVEVTESVLAFQEARIRKAGIEVRKELVFSQPLCTFPGELRQIFTNLIGNAIDAMGKGGKLVVRVHPAENRRSRTDGYRIIIADTGPGVPPPIRYKLLEPFFTTKGEKGTGLGLWITKQLVEKHGGYMKFRSRYGAANGITGTVFSVWLPLQPEFANHVDVDRATA